MLRNTIIFIVAGLALVQSQVPQNDQISQSDIDNLAQYSRRLDQIQQNLTLIKDAPVGLKTGASKF